jgi:hypothetical protein
MTQPGLQRKLEQEMQEGLSSGGLGRERKRTREDRDRNRERESVRE